MGTPESSACCWARLPRRWFATPDAPWWWLTAPDSHTSTNNEEAMKTDSQLKTDVMRELAWDTHVDETALGGSAHHGIVTLNGVVDGWAEKHAAEEAAHRVAGVLDVANDIEIQPSWRGTRTDAETAEGGRGARDRRRPLRGEPDLGGSALDRRGNAARDDQAGARTARRTRS